MDNKKFEQLIDLIINENEEQARALFHDIVVEKSRQIYENLMDEEMNEMSGQDESMGMLDELGDQTHAEEIGMHEEDDEFSDIEVDGEDGLGDDDEMNLDSDDMDRMEGGEEDLEDRVVDLEDKLDQLMAEFEEIMGNEEGHEGGEESDQDMMGDEDQDMMESEEEDLEESEEEDLEESEEDTLEEAIQLKKVSVTHGDNGQQTKSPVAGKNSMISSNGASAANLNKGYSDSGKGGTQGGVLNPATKDIKHANAYGNSPNSFKFKEKGEAAPKATKGDDGVNKKSVVESKKSVKKPVAQQATKRIVKK
jgi:hypothetical protein